MGDRVFRFGTLCVSVVMFAVMLAAGADAYVSLGLSDGRCFDDGSFSLEVRNFGDTRLDLDRVTVTAMPQGSDDDAFSVIGSFGRDALYEGSSYTTTTTFRSRTGNLNDSGTYRVAMTYPDCRYGTCAEEITLERCPGFPYQCKLADVHIDKCFERNGALQIYVSGINNHQYEKIDPLRELALSLRSNARTIIGKRYADDVTVKPHGADAHIVSVPLKPGEKVSEASLELMRCSEPPYLREMDICTVPESDALPRDDQLVPGPASDVTQKTDGKDARELEPDTRAGRNRITDHVSTDSDERATETGSVLPTLLMASIGILWLAATFLVIVLLVQNARK